MTRSIQTGNDAPTAGAGLPCPPEAGDYAELPTDILWLRMPVPGALRHINLWLLPASQGWWLVDTGMDVASVRAAWQSLEKRLPLGRELQGIIVTHHHPDHFGMASWLAGRHGVPVYMTRASHAATLSALAPSLDAEPSRAEDFAGRFGLQPDEDMRRILRGGIYRSIVSGPVEAIGMAAGARVGDGTLQWRVSVHHGHAPGHACLHDAAARILISGDQLLPSISSNVSLYPSNEQEDPLGQYVESLRELSRLPEDTLVLPAHGRPFATLHARAQALTDEHAMRLRQIVLRITEGASTLQIADHLFSLSRLDALNRLLAVTETLAHLRWLELRGFTRRNGEERGMRWLATAHSADLPPSPFALQNP